MTAEHSRAAAAHAAAASWSEPEFAKVGWYPPGLPTGRRLGCYAGRFGLVELNSSFYAPPQAAVYERRTPQTLPGFLLDVKCHRLLPRPATKADAVHVIFNNNRRGIAPFAAERLRHKHEQTSGRDRAAPQVRNPILKQGWIAGPAANIPASD